ncbi:MAG: hypothetical protein ACPGF7_12315 [Pontibacterium sp.]
MNQPLRQLLPVLLVLFSVHLAAETLLRNPFARPATISPVPALKQDQPKPATAPLPVQAFEQTADLNLRGIMVAGDASVINLGGVMLSIGDEVNGLRLVSVSEESALFTQGAKQIRIYVNGQKGSTP